MAQWYYTVNGQQAGPVDDAQMRAMIQNGQVQPTDLIWREGMASWSEARTVPEFGAAPVATYQPPQGYQQPGYAQPVGYASPYGGGGARPTTYLWQSIVCIFCCWPLAIPAIVFAAQVNSKYAAGDYAGAAESSRKAKQFMSWGFGIGVVLLIIRIIALIALETR